MNNTTDILNYEKISKVKDIAKKLYAEVNPELNKACVEYQKKLEELGFQLSKITDDFSSELFKLNKTNIANGLHIEDINLDSLDLNTKSTDELISLYNAIRHYSFLGTLQENTNNKVIPTIISVIGKKTNSNEVRNYIYQNLYEDLTEQQINDIYEEISKEEN